MSLNQAKTTETIRVYGDPVETANFDGLVLDHHSIFQSSGDPELIVRSEPTMGYGRTPVEFLESVRSVYAANAAIVNQLHSKYGINSPGYIVIDDTKNLLTTREVLVGTNKIHGQYFSTST